MLLRIACNIWCTTGVSSCPTLFLAFINDLPESVTYHISLFADDTLIYKAVTWCMQFNVDKCSVLIFNPSQPSPQASYNLDGNPLQITQETK